MHSTTSTHTMASTPENANGDNGEELFQIIDETGEGWGFDLTPAVVMRPLASISATFLGLGMLAGIPAGLWVGRNQLSSDGAKKKVRPTAEGFLFATKAFACGTALCGALGVAGFYTLRWYYSAETFEDFGREMRVVIPQRRAELENGLGPAVSQIRILARESLPAPLARLREKFEKSRTGVWLREQVANASTPPDELLPNDQLDPS